MEARLNPRTHRQRLVIPRCEESIVPGQLRSILRLAGADIHRPNSAMACRSGASGRDRVHWCHAVEPAALPGQVEHVAMRTPSR